jgi:hypothetical protein
VHDSILASHQLGAEHSRWTDTHITETKSGRNVWLQQKIIPGTLCWLYIYGLPKSDHFHSAFPVNLNIKVKGEITQVLMQPATEPNSAATVLHTDSIPNTHHYQISEAYVPNPEIKGRIKDKRSAETSHKSY